MDLNMMSKYIHEVSDVVGKYSFGGSKMQKLDSNLIWLDSHLFTPDQSAGH
jgi:hypothetical protein